MLAVLKSIMLNGQPQWKMVIMSASLDIARFQNYFINMPIIEVPGRMYEVKEFFLEDFIDSLDHPANDHWALKQHFKDHGGQLNLINLKSEYKSVYGPQKCESILEIEMDGEIALKPYARLINKIDNEQPTGAILVFLPGNNPNLQIFNSKQKF